MFLTALLISSLAYTTVTAQVNVSVNIGLQPVWGPVGYEHVDYYYLPEIEGYYDIPHRQFIYFNHGAWVHAAALPPQFGHVDLYHTYKVVINEPDPWLRHDVYKAKYVSYKTNHNQVVIRDSHEPRYWEIKEHPEHNKWHGEGKHEEHHEERHEPHGHH